MGSGSPTRKASDIPQPKPRHPKSGSGGGGSSGSGKNFNCPLKFKIGLKPNQRFKTGQVIELSEEKGNLVLLLGSRVVHTMHGQKADLIIKCLHAGFRYGGSVVVDAKGRVYAVFERLPA